MKFTIIYYNIIYVINRLLILGYFLIKKYEKEFLLLQKVIVKVK